MNLNPVPASAGWNVRVTGKPECTPTPHNSVWSQSVVCLATFILPSHTFPSRANQRHTADHAGDIGRIPAIGKAVHTRGQAFDRAVPRQKPLRRWKLSGGWRQLQLTLLYRVLP